VHLHSAVDGVILIIYNKNGTHLWRMPFMRNVCQIRSSLFLWHFSLSLGNYQFTVIWTHQFLNLLLKELSIGGHIIYLDSDTAG
jgi:hypothetical protein